MRNALLILAAVLVSPLSAQPWANQPWALKRLDATPRHLEWVTLKHGDRELKAFVGFPEVSHKATAIVVIHENQGLTDWVRSVVDQFAEAGYIAIAPDCLSGTAPGGGATPEHGSADNARKAIGSLPPAQVTADVQAAMDYVAKLPAANGKVVVAGFCWGGSQTFRFATNNTDIKAAFVFYGSAPTDQAELAKITAPVYGFYGGNDARINAGIPKTTELMKAAGKKYQPIIYDGAGHGFMRAADAPDASAANTKARDEAWQRMKTILSQI